MSDIDLSLVIPCYNEELILRDSIKQVFEVLDNTKFNYEIIFVDDCSRDNTRKIIDDVTSLYPDKQLTKIFHEKNTGRGGAVMDGIRVARGEVVGFIDIDLEVHARYIGSCVLAVKNGADVATARRIYKFYLKFIVRYVMSRGYIALARKLLKIDLADTETGFKFFNRQRILPVMEETIEKGWFWDTEIMVRSYLKGYKIEEIPCLFLRNLKKPSTVKNVSDSIDYFKKLLKFRKTLRKEKTDTAVKNYWQNTPKLFSEQYAGGKNLFVNDFLTKRLSRISGLLDVAKGMEALDVGCGSGVFGKFMIEKGARVTAVDYSREALDICDRELAPFGKENYSLVNCDASSMPLPDNKFDMLVSVGLLDYVDDVNKVLGEFRRVIKPKSKLIFTVPKSNSPFFLLRTRFGAIIRNNIFGLPCIKTALSSEEVKRAARKADLVLTEIEPFYMTMWIVQCEKV